MKKGILKKGICLAAIFLFSVWADAHPGKTDRRGGHKCLKNCGEWELWYGEYHLHDKDWKPIRINAKGNPIPPVTPGFDAPPAQEPQEQAKPEQKPVQSAGEILPEKPERKTVNEYRHTTVVHEENMLSFNNILLLILAFFFLLALIFIRQKRGKAH